MPHLRVLAGPSLAALEPISDIVNTNETCRISSPFFDGELVANIRGFVNEKGDKIDDGPYFDEESKAGITWSIMARGRFLVPISADDILFGNTFDRPLKLPWGTSAALKFASYIDPTLEHDLASPTKPWALSPLISTMPNFVHKRESEETKGPFPPQEPIKDYVAELHLARSSATHRSSPSISSSSSISSAGSSNGVGEGRPKLKKSRSALGKLSAASRSVSSLGSKRSKSSSPEVDEKYSFTSASERRSYFSAPEHRKELVFGPDDVIATDFCYGFFNFSPTISLRIPGGLEFDLMRYWDKQPVRFMCCARKGWKPPAELEEEIKDNEEEDAPWGPVFWCMALESVED